MPITQEIGAGVTITTDHFLTWVRIKDNFLDLYKQFIPISSLIPTPPTSPKAYDIIKVESLWRDQLDII